MSSSRPRLQRLQHPVLPDEVTAEAQYWRGFASPQLVKENNPITHIHFNPVTNDFAVALGTRIQVFSGKTRQIVRSFSRFKDKVFSGEYRHDGKLMVAADALGQVSVYDAQQPGSLLVTMRPSLLAAQVAKFHPSVGRHVVVGLDDRAVRLYDISQAATPLVEYGDEHHGDYVRLCCFVPGNPNLVVLGCYDGVVRVFDTRQPRAVAKFSQGWPVEDVLALSPTSVVSAGGPVVKVWDLALGAALHELGNFTKTATLLHDAGDGLLVGSLDGHVKVFDHAHSWDVKHSWKFDSGVLATAVAPNHRHLATGLALGLLSIQTRPEEAAAPQKKTHSARYQRLMRGADYTGLEEHLVVTNRGPELRKHLRPYEKHLNAFRWADALDSVVAEPDADVVTLLHELRRRGKTRIALHGRDEALLVPIVRYLADKLGDSTAFALVCDYLAVVLEMYGLLLDRSVVLEEALAQLAQRVDAEVSKCKEASEIEGMLELLAIK